MTRPEHEEWCGDPALSRPADVCTCNITPEQQARDSRRRSSWPRPKDRIVVSGFVDDRDAETAWIIIDDARGVSQSGIPLLRVPHERLVPELTPHVILANQWHTGAERDQVLLLGKLVSEADHGRLVQVEFTNTFPTGPLRITIERSSVIFGQVRDGHTA